MAERCIYSHNFSHSCSWQLWKTRTQGRGCRKTARWSSKLAQSFWCQNIFDLSQQVFSRFPSQFELAYLVNSQVADWKCLVVHFYASQEAGLKVAEYLHTAKMLQGMSLVVWGPVAEWHWRDRISSLCKLLTWSHFCAQSLCSTCERDWDLKSIDLYLQLTVKRYRYLHL